jgi:hypothetical protein
MTTTRNNLMTIRRTCDLMDSVMTCTPMLRGRWTIVGLLFVASLINDFDRATISFALPLISKDPPLGPGAKAFCSRRSSGRTR